MYLLARFFMDRKKKTQKNAYFSGFWRPRRGSNARPFA